MHIKHFRPILLILGLIILGLTIVVMIRQTFSKNVPSTYSPQHNQQSSIVAVAK